MLIRIGEYSILYLYDMITTISIYNIYLILILYLIYFITTIYSTNSID